MAWFSGKVSLGNLDFAGAVNKLSESVKNIEKNFDSALGLEEKSDADAAAAASDSEASGILPSATDRKDLVEPTVGLVGQRGGKDIVESPYMSIALDPTSSVKDKHVVDDNSVNQKSEVIPGGEGVKEELRDIEVETGSDGKIKDTSGVAEENAASDHSEAEVVSPPIPVEAFEQKSEEVQHTESASNLQEEERLEEVIPTLSETVQPGSTDNLQEKGSEIISSTLLESLQPESVSSGDSVGDSSSLSNIGDATSLSKSIDDENAKTDVEDGLPDQTQDASLQGPTESRESHVSDVPVSTTEAEDSCADNRSSLEYNRVEASKAASDLVTPLTDAVSDSVDLKQHLGKDVKERMSSASNSSNIADSVAEHEKVMKEMKMMEAALHGAARQSQAKADEIARLMNENEQLKTAIDELKKRKTNEAEIESLREEYHQKVAVLERKIYALTRERDTLRREQNKKSDAAALLKEKDEIINQISCLRAEQTQLTRSLEKERHKAAEHRQEYLALKEEADTNESHVNQLEEELKELRRKHTKELHDALMHQELLQQELEREKAARLDQERAARIQSSTAPDQVPIARQKAAAFDSGNLTRKISSASSLGSMEESFFLQTTLGSSETISESRSVGDGAMSPYYMKSVTSNTFEAALRQKEGELASYASRLASLESIRDSLAEELVKLTAECEKLRTEAATLPGIRAELEALRRRHSAALELMGERDEELEELRADIVDLKEMYREQVNLLVNKIHILSSSMAAS